MMKVKYSRYLIIFFLLMCIIASIFNNKMHLSSKSSYHQVISEAVTIAISNLKYDLPGYIGYTEMRDKINNYGTIDNNILQEIILLQNQNFDKSEKMLMGNANIGYSDFIKLAFLLFDYNVSSLVYLYLIIFIISILIYTLEFKNNPTAISILIFFLVSYYFILLAIIKNSQLGIIYNPRVMSLLGVVPFLHLIIFAIFKGNQIKTYSIIFIILQSIILAWVYNIRFTILWMYIFFAVLLLFQLLTTYKSRTNYIGVKNKLLINLNKIYPLLIAFIIFSIFSINYNSAKNIEYNNSLGKHVFWHSILSGILAYDDTIFLNNTGIKREKNHDNINFCNIDKYAHVKETIFIRKTICKSLNAKFLSTFINFLYRESSDQDVYSATVFSLYKNNQDIYQLYNFPKNAPINIAKNFEIFQFNEGLKNKIILKDSDNYRNMNMSVDFNWTKHEELSKQILIENIKRYPFKIIKILILKPVYFIPELFKYFTGNFFSFLIIIFVYYWFLKKEGSSTFDKRYLFMMLALLPFTLMAPIITYFDIVTMPDAVLFFLIFLFFLLYGFLSKLSFKENNLL